MPGIPNFPNSGIHRLNFPRSLFRAVSHVDTLVVRYIDEHVFPSRSSRIGPVTGWGAAASGRHHGTKRSRGKSCPGEDSRGMELRLVLNVGSLRHHQLRTFLRSYEHSCDESLELLHEGGDKLTCKSQNPIQSAASTLLRSQPKPTQRHGTA